MPIGDLTGDLRAVARDMEGVKYPAEEVVRPAPWEGVKYPAEEVVRPAPSRVLGKRGRGSGNGRGDFLGSRWDEGSDSAEGARALRGAGLESASCFSA